MGTRPPSVAAITRWMSVSVAVQRDMNQTTVSSVCALEAGRGHHAPVSVFKYFGYMLHQIYYYYNYDADCRL